MSSIAQQWRGVARLLTRTLGSTDQHPERGENVTLRRPGTIEDVVNDATPRELVFIEDTPATVVSITLGLAAGTALTGALPGGARLTIDGMLYTLNTQSSVSAPGATSITVNLANQLVADVTAGTVVRLQPDALFTLTDCHVIRKQRRDLTSVIQADTLAVIRVPIYGQPVTPRLDDSLELEDGTVGRCAGLPITTGAFWSLQFGL